MSDLLIPDSRFEKPELFYPGRKPVGNVKIDWEHPLADGLAFFMLLNTDVDLVSGRPIGNGGVKPELVTGKGVDVKSSTGKYHEFDSPVFTGSNCTIVCKFQRAHISTYNMGMVSNKVIGNWGVAEGVSLNIRSDGGLLYKVGAAEASSTIDMTLDTSPHTIAAWSRAGELLDGAIDGVKVNWNSSQEAAPASNPASTLPLMVGRYYSGLGAFETDGLMYYAMGFNKGLDFEKTESLHANPYQFLIPAT